MKLLHCPKVSRSKMEELEDEEIEETKEELITLYSLKWKNGLIIRLQAWEFKGHGIGLCTYEKSKHREKCNKSYFQ